MKTVNPPDALERRIDTALAKLPEWQPPADFTARLAAAAARQSTPSARGKPDPTWVVALESLNKAVPTALWSAGVAAILVWVVPWAELTAGTGLIWVCGVAMGTAGLALTLRLLREP